MIGGNNMKNIRQAKMLELIREQRFDTQEDLLKALCNSGFNVTQATISRDIRELGIIKSEGEDGDYRYRVSARREHGDINGKLASIFRQAAFAIDCANNLIVIKTYTGMGSAVGAALDSMEIEGVIGTLAGDDTLLMIIKDNERAAVITAELREAIS